MARFRVAAVVRAIPGVWALAAVGPRCDRVEPFGRSGSDRRAAIGLAGGIRAKMRADAVDGNGESKERLRWERRCLERARVGEREAFAELYRRYAPMIFTRVLLPRLGDRSAAEDALAETFRTALEKLASFEARDVSIYYWLARIATNKAMDMHRVTVRTSRALTQFHGLLSPLHEPVDEPLEHAERERQRNELAARIGRVLKRIHPRYRSAIELRLVRGQSRQDCAERMGVKVATFDVILLRSLRAFRKEWEQERQEDAL